MKNILIIGASGYIGSKLYDFCQQPGYHVTGTCHLSKDNEKFISYNMERDDIRQIAEGLEGERHAVICAGESKISVCKEKRDEVYRLNVVATQNIAKQLSELGYHIIYCSSDNVYDGKKGDYKETDLVNPVNEYGKMKAQVEKYVLHNCPTACVIRLSKVVGVVDSEQDMLKEWKDAALKQKDIYCIKGNYFNPIDINDVILCIMQIIEKRLSGIFNICGNKRYTRIELCREFLSAISLQTNIYEKQLEEFGFNDNRPLDTSMCNQKIVDIVGKEIFHDMRWCFERYCGKQ